MERGKGSVSFSFSFLSSFSISSTNMGKEEKRKKGGWESHFSSK